MTVQIVHTADLHLDRNFNIVNLARRDERKKDVESNFEHIADYAIQNRPDFLLLAGDIFDRVNPGNPTRELLVRKLREVREAGVKTFVIGGNHDVPKLRRGSGALAIDVLEAAGVARVFSQSDRFVSDAVKVDGEKVVVAGRSYEPQSEETNPFSGNLPSLDGVYNIILVHASLQITSAMPNDLSFIRQNPFSLGDVPHEANYVALGHYHNPFVQVRGDSWIVNPGSIERLTWGEVDDSKGFVWGEISSEGVEIENMKLPTRPRTSLELELGRDERGDLTETVNSFLEENEAPDAICRLLLKGVLRPEQHQTLRVREIYDRARDLYFHFALDQKEVEVEGFGRVFLERVDSPQQAFEKRVERLIAEQPEEKAFLRQVKQRGLEYLGGTV